MTTVKPKRVAAQILERQLQWASLSGKFVESGCLASVEENLVQPLSAETRSEFTAGAGNELGLAQGTHKRPKMTSLRSSSVFAVNFFEPLRGTDLRPLGAALGLDFQPSSLRFEAKRPHGLTSGTPPHLDVLLEGPGPAELGIESKFAELYDSKPTNAKSLKDAYFEPEDKKRWAERGLPRCQAYAESLRTGPEFERLDAAQLLKHILGLAHEARPGTRVRLAYLWYEVPGSESDLHRREVQEFARRVGDELLFIALPYQEVFQRVEATLSPKHRAYLADRYF